MAGRRLRDSKGRIIKKDGTIDKRSQSSKANLKKSSLYQKVIKNKEIYESDSDDDTDEEVEDEFEIVEIKKKEVKPVEVVEPKPEPKPVEVVQPVVDIEEVKPIEPQPIVEVKPLKKQRKLKVIKEESDSDTDEDDDTEVEVVKKKRYNKKINSYESMLKKQREENENLKKNLVYNTHLNRVNHLSRKITLKF